MVIESSNGEGELHEGAADTKGIQGDGASPNEEAVGRAPPALALLDEQLRFIWVNRAMAAIDGVAVAAHGGRSIDEVLGDVLPELAASVDSTAARVVEDGSFVLTDEVRTFTAAGDERWWMVVAWRVSAESPAAYVAIVALAPSSLSSRPLARASLFESALRELPCAIAVAAAPSERLLLANRVLEKIVAPSIAVGRIKRDEGALLHLDGSPMRREELPILRALHTGSAVDGEDFVYVTAGGCRTRLRSRAAPVLDPHGRVVASIASYADVTERSRAQQALEESEQQFRKLVEDVSDYAIYMLDDTGRVLSWNIGAERITGFTAAEVLGRSHSVFFPQEDVLLGRHEHMLTMARELGRFEEEGWRRRKDGSRFWATSAITTMRGPDGRARGFSKIVHDRTASRLIEEALHDSNRRIASILESVSDAFCALDREERFTFVNPEAERVLGRSRTNLIGHCLSSALPELCESNLLRELHRALDKNVAIGLEEFIKPLDRWIEMRAYPSPAGLSVYLRDVTERKRAETAQAILAHAGRILAESLDFAATIEQVVCIAVPDLADWCVAAVYNDDDRPPHHAVAHIDPERREWARRALDRILPSAHEHTMLGRVLRSGNSEIYTDLTDDHVREAAISPEHLEMLREADLCSVMVVPLRARGRSHGALAFGSSTPGRRYQPSDLEFAEEVGRRAAMAVDNARLYREAREAIQTREDLVSIASHDLRTPLATLKLRVQMLLRDVRANRPVPEQLATGLDGVLHQVDRLTDLVNLFLEISRVTAGRIDLKLEEVDAAALVRETAARLAEPMAAAGSTMKISAERPIVGRWDPSRVEQIVSNLLSNAVKYGGGGTVEVSVEQANGMARISVRDHGIGISEDDQRHLFERFRRAKSGREQAGFGLGLWIVKRVVDRLGGTIRVESSVGVGSTFTVELPVGPHKRISDSWSS